MKVQPVEDSNVKVAVRCRPMSAKETKDGHQSIVEFEDGHKVIINNVGESPSDQLGTRSGERSNVAQVYEFDAVFDWNSTQETVYNSVCRPIVEGVLGGYNGTIFAYGQTGTGKTYTMEGLGNRSSRRTASEIPAPGSVVKDSAEDTQTVTNSAASAKLKLPAMRQQQQPASSQDESRGVIPRAFKHIFDHIAGQRDVQFLVRASYMEIYQEEIHDLLKKDRSQQKLNLHERPDTGVYVKDLTSYVCKSIEEIERVMRVGNQNRKVGATDMNEHSSRSHAIFVITIEQQHQHQQPELESERPELAISANQMKTQRNNKQQVMIDTRPSVQSASSSSSSSSSAKNTRIRVGQLNLVDLAGSERQRKTNNSGQRHKESIKINLSLSALGNVINSLMKINGQQQSNKAHDAAAAASRVPSAAAINKSDGYHVPYRDSKLTRLLQDSLGGNSRTLMIANIGPASYNYDETINTLNYASRAKCIRNRPRLNEDPKDALLRQLQSEIRELRSRLASMTTTTTRATTAKGEPLDHGRVDASKRSIQNPINGKSSVEQELAEIRSKLASLEGKLLNSSGASSALPTTLTGAGQLDQRLLEGYTRQQAEQLAKNKAELMDQANRERIIRNELERREEAELEIKQSFSSVQQEVDAKRALIRKVLLKTKALRDDLEVSQNAYRVELDELDQLQFVLQKELRLKCLIMDNFIPNHHVNQLLPRINYDERRDTCSVEPIDLPLDYCNLESPRNQYSEIWQPSEDCIRPRSELERISETINPSDARYKYKDVLNLRVEAPNLGEPKTLPNALDDEPKPETTSQQASKIQTLIEAALNQHEPDIVI